MCSLPSSDVLARPPGGPRTSCGRQRAHTPRGWKEKRIFSSLERLLTARKGRGPPSAGGTCLHTARKGRGPPSAGGYMLAHGPQGPGPAFGGRVHACSRPARAGARLRRAVQRVNAFFFPSPLSFFQSETEAEGRRPEAEVERRKKDTPQCLQSSCYNYNIAGQPLTRGRPAGTIILAYYSIAR